MLHLPTRSGTHHRLFLVHNIMVSFLFLFLSLLICLPAAAEEPSGKKRVAVLNFSGVNIPSQVIESTTESAREGALDMLPPDKFQLMTKENTQQILTDMGLDMSCIQSSCEVETLRSIQAHYGVTGNIRQLEQKYELTISLFASQDATLLGIKKGEYDNLRELKQAAKQNTKLLVANIPEAGLGSSISIASATVRKAEIYRGEDIVNTPTGKYGFLVITSEPKGAAIFVNGESIGQTPLQKDFPEGDYVVVADMGAIYHPATAKIKITDGDTNTLNLQLKPSHGSIVVRSTPSGAKVYISGEYVGDTPYENNRLPSDIYNIQVRKDKHFDHQERIIIEDEKTTTIDSVLTRSVSDIEISSTPSGADIWLNGSPTGEITPYTFRNKPPGQYDIRLVKEKHKPADSVTTLEAGKDAQHHSVLDPNFGGLQIVTNPPGVRIILNGQDSGRTTPTTFEALNAGINVLELQKEGYGTEKERITIPDDGSTLTVTRELAAKLGAVMLTSTTPKGEPCLGGEIYINGEKIEETTPRKLSLVAAEQEIIVRCDGMKGSQKVAVKHNETIKINILVQKRKDAVIEKQGTVLLTSTSTTGTPCKGGEIYIDGEKIAKTTPSTLYLAAENQTIMVKCNGMKGAQSLLVKANQVRKLDIKLKTMRDPNAKMGKVALTSATFDGQPCKDGEIYIDGEKIDETTPNTLSLVAEEQEIMVKCSERKGRKLVKVKSDQTINVDITVLSIYDVFAEEKRLKKYYRADAGLIAIIGVSLFRTMNNNQAAEEALLSYNAADTPEWEKNEYNQLAESAQAAARMSMVAASVATGVLAVHYLRKTRAQQRRLKEIRQAQEGVN